MTANAVAASRASAPADAAKRAGAAGAERPARPPRRDRRAGLRSQRRREALAAYAFLAPDLIGLIVLVLAPMALALGVSFYEVDGFGGYEFVGLDNFRQMFEDDKLAHSLRVTGLYVAAYVPVGFAISLGLALLVRRQFPGVGLVRTLLFVPHVISLVVIGVLWDFMLAEKRGPVTWLLRPFGLGDVSWLGDPDLALYTVVAISIWFAMGFQMLIFLAGLQDIPPELEEAATLDGAGPVARFRYVTWPLLRPTSFFVLVSALVVGVTGLQAFDLVYVLTQGGPANRTETVVFYIYQQAFEWNRIGYASAITVVVVMALLVVTAAMFAVTRGGRFADGSDR